MTNYFLKRTIVEELGLTFVDAALYLSVTEPTLRAWIAGTEVMPNDASRAIESWRFLKRYRLPWRPTPLPLDCDPNEIPFFYQFHRSATGALAVAAIKRGRRRITFPWVVDLDRNVATLDSVTGGGLVNAVHFVVGALGGFRPSGYHIHRADVCCHNREDMIDQAYIRFARAVAREPHWNLDQTATSEAEQVTS